MTTIVTRQDKGSALTWTEADNNFTNLNNNKVEYSTLASDTGSSLIGYRHDITSAVATTVQSKLRESVSVKDFGAVGDGVTDDTTKLQNALNAAAGKVLFLEAGRTYGYTSLTIKNDTTVISNGATFNRLAASTSHGFTIESGVTVDSLVIATPGGASGDKGVLIKGSNVAFGKLSVTAVAQGVYNSTNFAVEISSVPEGTQLANIRINSFYCKYFSAGMFIKNVERMAVANALIEYYRIAFYLRDVAKSQFDNVTCNYTASTSYGTNGENGLLIESTLASGSSHDLHFNGWTVTGAGEHSYRLGGSLTIRDIWFTNCRSWGSGSSIVVGNPNATEWHGGCGFKVLGGGEQHKNIYFNNCTVQDCNTVFGTFPAGHGINNFSAYMVINAVNVHFDSCSISARNQTYAARRGLLLAATENVTLSGCNFRDLSEIVIAPHEEVPGFTYQDKPIVGLYINGGLFEITNPTNGIPFYAAINAAYDHKNWTVAGATFKGGTSAIRIETPAAGSYSNINLDFTYVDSNVPNATHTNPVVVGAITALVTARAPWRPLAFSPAARDGSVWQDTLNGQIYEKSDNVWRRGRKTYNVQIPNDGVATIVPPPDLDPGFILVAGGGIATHLMGWYRATSSPQSIKYAGATTAVMVNTPLTGTTGVVGNITIGIQEDLIYIENRNGSTNTFTVTFL